MNSANKLLGVVSFIVAVVLINGQNRSRFGHRIINGVQVNIKDYNYYVYIGSPEAFCGGVLVHTDKVITAAHCEERFKAPLPVYPGLNSLSELSSTRKYISNTWRKHDNYNRSNFVNDICVVILTENVVLSDKIGTISLARTPPPINSYITLVGHGATDCSTQVNNHCVVPQSDPLLKTDGLVAGYKGSMIAIRDTPNRPCKGDSGGPWTYRGQLVAVVSYSRGAWCDGGYHYETTTMLGQIPQFLAKFGIYPQ